MKIAPFWEAKTPPKISWGAKTRFWRVRAKFPKRPWAPKIHFWGAPPHFLSLPGRSGVDLGAGRDPQAPGDPILEALGVDFHTECMFSCRKNHMFARTRDPARRSLLARGGLRAAHEIRRALVAPGVLDHSLHGEAHAILPSAVHACSACMLRA